MKLLGILNPPWKEFGEKTFTTIESHAGMAEQMVRDLTIEEDIQE